MVKAQATAMSCLGRSLGLQKYLSCGKTYYPFCLFYTQISACGKICLEKAFCPVDTGLIHWKSLLYLQHLQEFIENTYLLKVGDAISGYLDPGCLRPGVAEALAEVGLDLGELDSETLSESDTATFSFSLSVWLMVTGLDLPDPILLGSRSLVAAAPADLLLTLESMLLVLERCPPRPGIPLPLDFDGRGRLRYCSVVFEFMCRTPSSWFWEPSKLVFRPALDFPPMAEDFGIFPRVAEPLVIVAPLVVIIVEEAIPDFLNPKDPVAVDLPMPEGGFFPSSPLLFPASDGERWMEAPFRGVFTFSEALASSVFPK